MRFIKKYIWWILGAVGAVGAFFFFRKKENSQGIREFTLPSGIGYDRNITAFSVPQALANLNLGAKRGGNIVSSPMNQSTNFQKGVENQKSISSPITQSIMNTFQQPIKTDMLTSINTNEPLQMKTSGFTNTLAGKNNPIVNVEASYPKNTSGSFFVKVASQLSNK